MTITSIQRPVTLQSITSNEYAYDNTQQCTQSQIEAHIYNLIQQGDIFNAKLHMQLINDTNGYMVISEYQFRQWRIEHLRNKNSYIKTDKSESQFSKKQNIENTNKKYQNSKKGKSNISLSSFQMEFQKAYMKLLSN